MLRLSAAIASNDELRATLATSVPNSRQPSSRLKTLPTPVLSASSGRARKTHNATQTAPPIANDAHNARAFHHRAISATASGVAATYAVAAQLALATATKA